MTPEKKALMLEFAARLEGLVSEPDPEFPGIRTWFDMRLSAEDRFKGEAGNCGAACCMGGWAHLWGYSEDPRPGGAFENAFDIPSADAVDLTYPPSDHPGWFATPAQAASVLRHYAETGVVDWDVIEEMAE